CRGNGRRESRVGGNGKLVQPARLSDDVSARDAGLRSSTITGSTKTSGDGSFAALNLSADTYTVCAVPGREYLFGSCNSSSVKLADQEYRTGIQIVLPRGSLVVITVKDPFKAIPTNFFLPGVIVGFGGYSRATYDTTRQAYTCLVLKGVL